MCVCVCVKLTHQTVLWMNQAACDHDRQWTIELIHAIADSLVLHNQSITFKESHDLDHEDPTIWLPRFEVALAPHHDVASTNLPRWKRLGTCMPEDVVDGHRKSLEVMAPRRKGVQWSLVRQGLNTELHVNIRFTLGFFLTTTPVNQHKVINVSKESVCVCVYSPVIVWLGTIIEMVLLTLLVEVYQAGHALDQGATALFTQVSKVTSRTCMYIHIMSQSQTNTQKAQKTHLQLSTLDEFSQCSAVKH